MKRHPAFQDLSRDHFTALNRSLQLVRAVEGHPNAWPYGEALAAFRALWAHGGLRQHFGEEETDLVPALRAHGGDGLADRMVEEHDELRGRFDALAEAGPEHAAETARLLTRHARWEEDTVFEWLQRTLGEAELSQLLERSRSYRVANGLPVNPPRV